MEEKKSKSNFCSKKVISLILVVFLFMFILTILLITLYSTVKASNLAFGKYSFYIMRTDTQPEIARRGDLVITKIQAKGEIQSGDKIVYSDNEFYYCEKIEETKGKANITKSITIKKDGIKYQLSGNEIKGKVVGSIQGLGEVITFFRTPFGAIVYILFIICVFFIMKKMCIAQKLK